MSETKTVKRRVVHALTVAGKEYPRNSIVELSESNAEIFKSRLCDPGESVDSDVDPRSKAAEYKAQVKELELRNDELVAQNRALHDENVRLKAGK